MYAAHTVHSWGFFIHRKFCLVFLKIYKVIFQGLDGIEEESLRLKFSLFKRSLDNP